MKAVPAARVLIAVSMLTQAASGSVIVPEGNGCPEATLKATLRTATFADGDLTVVGDFLAGGSAAGLLVEYRVDSDRYRSEIRQGTGGELRTTFPYKLCGDHAAQLWVYPLVTDGTRQAVCLGRSSQTKVMFNAGCGAAVRFEGCEWKCDGAGACHGTCEAVISGEDVLAVSAVEGGPFQAVTTPADGHAKIAFDCRAGQKIRLRARVAGSSDFSAAIEHACGQP